MKLAVISDIHANLEALEAVMRDIETQQAEKIVCLGDTIGYGADPIPCMDLVERHCDTRLMGNHEYAVLGKLPSLQINRTAKISLAWTQAQLQDSAFSRIANLPMTASIGDLFFVHASPWEPERWRYVLSAGEAEAAFRNFSQRICFNGHSHLPMIFASADNRIRVQAGHQFQPNEETRYIVNVGSVGQPRDNDPRACYVTHDSDGDEIAFHRVDYDIAKAQHKMRQADLPAMLIQRLQSGM
jgi:diadenosine tetraphosphatase ApaH/serine/threonine PP2A family protein phosphatase